MKKSNLWRNVLLVSLAVNPLKSYADNLSCRAPLGGTDDYKISFWEPELDQHSGKFILKIDNSSISTFEREATGIVTANTFKVKVRELGSNQPEIIGVLSGQKNANGEWKIVYDPTDYPSFNNPPETLECKKWR